MKRLTEIEVYRKRLEAIAADKTLGWERINRDVFLITGATGTIGKMLVDVLMLKNQAPDFSCKVLAIGRSKEKAEKRLGEYFGNEDFRFLEIDICKGIEINERVDFVVQTASATDPVVFAKDPVGVIMPNVIGLNNLAQWSVKHKVRRLLFLSSVEAYGENVSEKKKFCENDLGYIDCNTVRSGYPEAKRLGEALLAAYRSQYGLDYVTLRLARVFGPTMLMDNAKSTSQFIMNAVRGENIVLKTAGEQRFSYVYVGDAVRAILWGLSLGKDGEAYNVADNKINISLKDFAEMCAKLTGVRTEFRKMTEKERKVYSKFTRLMMDTEKIERSGFAFEGDFEGKIKETLEVMKQIEADK